VIKILHIAHRIPPLYSGAGRQAYNLVGYLRELAPDYHFDLISFVTAEDLVDNDRYNLSGTAKISSFISLLFRIYNRKYTIVHVHGASRFILMLLVFSPRNLKVVLKNTMEGIDDYNSLSARYPIIFRWLVRTKIVIGIYLIPELSINNSGYRSSYCISNGVDIKSIYDIKATRENIVLFAGGNDLRKGRDKLERFWLYHKSNYLELILCGRDSGLINLDQSISYGLVESTIPLMQQSKYLFFWYIKEGLPNILLEALFMNLNLIINESGYQKYEHLMLFKEIVVLSDKDSSVVISTKRNVDSEYRRRIIMQYNLKTVSNKYLNLYDSLVSARK
jgi:hypothetical protein